MTNTNLTYIHNFALKHDLDYDINFNNATSYWMINFRWEDNCDTYSSTCLKELSKTIKNHAKVINYRLKFG